eukprot:scaffold6092_cov105-Skeletonema_marinoi.AAC.3
MHSDEEAIVSPGRPNQAQSTNYRGKVEQRAILAKCKKSKIYYCSSLDRARSRVDWGVVIETIGGRRQHH